MLHLHATFFYTPLFFYGTLLASKLPVSYRIFTISFLTVYVFFFTCSVYCLTSFSHSQLDIASATFLSIYVDVDVDLLKTTLLMTPIPCFLLKTTLLKTLTPCYLLKTTVLKTLTPCYLLKITILKTLAPCYLLKTTLLMTSTPCYLLKTTLLMTLTPCYLLKTTVLHSHLAIYWR